MKCKTIVLGLGNPLMADEGVGPAVIERLGLIAEQYPDVEFVDAGAGGMTLLHLLDGRSKAILIDCAKMDTAAGTIRRFAPEQVESVKKLTHQSLHEADIMRIIEIARQLDQCPQEIVIFGIEPERIDVDRQLSPTIAAALDGYVELIRSELAR